MADVLSRNVFALLDPDENAQLNEGAKQPASVNKKEADKNKSKAVDAKKPADKTRAARGETRLRNEYPKRGGLRGVNGTPTDGMSKSHYIFVLFNCSLYFDISSINFSLFSPLFLFLFKKKTTIRCFRFLLILVSFFLFII